VKRFHYSALQNDEACEGIVRAESIDSARAQLVREGYEEITLSLLSSLDYEFGQDESEDLPALPR
jgi:hypothetical protein